MSGERDATKFDYCIRTSSGTCKCLPKCAVCGWGPHVAVHLPAYRNGVQVREYYDHAYVPRRPRDGLRARGMTEAAGE